MSILQISEVDHQTSLYVEDCLMRLMARPGVVGAPLGAALQELYELLLGGLCFENRLQRDRYMKILEADTRYISSNDRAASAKLDLLKHAAFLNALPIKME